LCDYYEQQPGIALPTTLATSQVAGVSYPTSRRPASVTPLHQSVPLQAATPSKQLQQRLFTGVVTKLHDNFGFIDDDVFFQTRW